MAKKAQKPAKKRKTSTIPKEEKEGEVVRLGTVSVVVQTGVMVLNEGPFNELVIELACLGLPEEPDSIIEVSANHDKLDPKRPITTDEEGLHLFFDPPLTGAGEYGFKFVCSYTDAAEARASKPKEDDDDDRTFEQKEGEKHEPSSQRAAEA